MNIWNHFMKDKNLCLKKPRTLGAWNHQFSSKGGGILCSFAFLGIYEAIFRGRDLIFFGEPHISINFTDTNIFFLIWQPGACSRTSSLPIFSAFASSSGSGRPEAGSKLSKLKNYFISVKYILIWGSPQKIRSLPLTMASHIMISLRMHNCIKSPPPLELNWRFQAPKVRGFFRHKFWYFMKCFQIFINVNLPFFKKKKF